MNEKSKRNVEKIKELILPLEKDNQQMILLCVANIAMGSAESDDYAKTVFKLTQDDCNELIERQAGPFTLAIHHFMQEVFKNVEEDEEN